jgi:glyoxylase-like metal-dependent hydrolase (beta-lactamase superfamily II)
MELASRAITAMGGIDRIRAIRHYEMRGGTGSRSRLGQVVGSGEADPVAKLANVTETFDLDGRRAALTYDVNTAGGFGQSRQEVLTTSDGRAIGLERVAGRPLAVVSPAGLFSWGTQNSPQMALLRNPVSLALAAAEHAAGGRLGERELDGTTYPVATLSLDGETVSIFFHPDTDLIAAVETTDTETMLGDVSARYTYEDYREVAGVLLPHRITIVKDGVHYADVQFTGASINDTRTLQVFDVPDDAAALVQTVVDEGDDYSPVELMDLGNGVHFARAYSHHSLVVEFPSFLAVVEAPYTEAQSKTLTRRLAAAFPSKPIRYAAVTHPHFDHTGGVRGIAAAGATILTARAHEPQIRPLLAASHTNPADALETRRRAGATVGGLEVFDDRKVLTDGGQTLELHAVSGSPHVEPMVLAFVPRAGVLFQSDLFFPGTGGAASPAAAHLLQAVRQLKLPVRVNAGGHGGVAPFDELVKAVGKD